MEIAPAGIFGASPSVDDSRELKPVIKLFAYAENMTFDSDAKLLQSIMNKSEAAKSTLGCLLNTKLSFVDVDAHQAQATAESSSNSNIHGVIHHLK